MNRNTLLAFAALLLLTATCTHAQDLRAEFTMARFDSPDEGPYLETYLRLKGASLTLRPEGGDEFPEVLISCTVTKGPDTVFTDTYKIKGPVKVKGEPSADFIDQQRIPLKNGRHELKMTIWDLNLAAGKEARITQAIDIKRKLVKVFLSDIQLVDSYSTTTEKNVLSKAGFDLVPYTSSYYAETKDELTFYAEVYNTARKLGTGEDFLMNMFIEHAENGKTAEGLRKYAKQKGGKVVPVLHTFPISELGSGNYNLVIEARDRKNELLDRTKAFFQRSNPARDGYTDPTAPAITASRGGTFVDRYHRTDELEQYLRCLHPISTQQEITQVNRKINMNDPEMMKNFLYNFWLQRNPENPEQAWLKYWKEVEKVNAAYSSNIHKGYDTDRGRVYLQYGPPNTISPFHFEAETYPYEIWHYYTLQDHLSAPQSDKKFIFANMNRGSKEFDLIHSDAVNEINNRHWNYDLHRRSNAIIDLNEEDGNDSFGGKPSDFYQNPY